MQACGVFEIPGEERYSGFIFQGECPIAVPFHLVGPACTVRQLCGRTREHGSEGADGHGAAAVYRNGSALRALVQRDG